MDSGSHRWLADDDPFYRSSSSRDVPVGPAPSPWARARSDASARALASAASLSAVRFASAARRSASEPSAFDPPLAFRAGVFDLGSSGFTPEGFVSDVFVSAGLGFACGFDFEDCGVVDFRFAGDALFFEADGRFDVADDLDDPGGPEASLASGGGV